MLKVYVFSVFFHKIIPVIRLIAKEAEFGHLEGFELLEMLVVGSFPQQQQQFQDNRVIYYYLNLWMLE